jgi:hypothetical protein
VLFEVSMTFLRSAVFAILAIVHLLAKFSRRLPGLNERLILNKNSGAASKDERGKSMKAVGLAYLKKGCCCNIAVTLVAVNARGIGPKWNCGQQPARLFFLLLLAHSDNISGYRLSPR